MTSFGSNVCPPPEIPHFRQHDCKVIIIFRRTIKCAQNIYDIIRIQCMSPPEIPRFRPQIEERLRFVWISGGKRLGYVRKLRFHAEKKSLRSFFQSSPVSRLLPS